MLAHLPEDYLIFIITLVATSSLKDLLHLRQTCKALKKYCLIEKVLNCCALEISLLNSANENRDYFYNLFESSGNPEFCFRMGLLNIRVPHPNYDSAKDLLYIAVQQGHDGAKYSLAILNIFSGNVEKISMGRTSLNELWSQKKLYKCRQMIREAMLSDGYWTLREESWPYALVYSRICVDRSAACKEPRLNRGVQMALSDEDYEFDTCINCRLDVEVEWFLKEVGYEP
jgi:hypothetical protein